MFAGCGEGCVGTGARLGTVLRGGFGSRCGGGPCVFLQSTSHLEVEWVVGAVALDWSRSLGSTGGPDTELQSQS